MSVISRDYATSLIGRHVQCHTHFGMFHGVVVHITKEHMILAPAYAPAIRPGYAPQVSAQAGYQSTADASGDDGRFGPWGYHGPGGGPYGGGPYGGGPGGGPGGPSGWHIAVPLAAIIGVTAIGMHWW